MTVFSVSLFIYPIREEHYLVLVMFAVCSLILMTIKYREVSDVSFTERFFDLILVLFWVWCLQFAATEPLVYDELAYGRHWCGVDSPLDGKCQWAANNGF